MDDDARNALYGLYDEVSNIYVEMAASNTLLSAAVTLGMKSSPDPELYLSALQGFSEAIDSGLKGEVALAAYQAKLDARLASLAAALS